MEGELVIQEEAGPFGMRRVVDRAKALAPGRETWADVAGVATTRPE